MGAPAALSSTTLLIDQVGLEFWGLLGIEVCKVPGIKKHPLVSSKVTGECKKGAPGVYSGGSEVGQKGC